MTHLNHNYLGDLEPDIYVGDDGDDGIGAEPTVSSGVPILRQPSSEVITLPGGVMLPKQTFWMLVALAVAIGIWWYMRSRREAK